MRQDSSTPVRAFGTSTTSDLAHLGILDSLRSRFWLARRSKRVQKRLGTLEQLDVQLERLLGKAQRLEARNLEPFTPPVTLIEAKFQMLLRAADRLHHVLARQLACGLHDAHQVNLLLKEHVSATGD